MVRKVIHISSLSDIRNQRGSFTCTRALCHDTLICGYDMVSAHLDDLRYGDRSICKRCQRIAKISDEDIANRRRELGLSMLEFLEADLMFDFRWVNTPKVRRRTYNVAVSLRAELGLDRCRELDDFMAQIPARKQWGRSSLQAVPNA